MSETTMMLSSEVVDSLFRACLLKEGDDQALAVKPEGGIITEVAFHRDRLNERRDLIESLLAELPDTFKESSGGGWSFLNACNDRHGRQWTSFHLVMAQLFQLGLGIGKVKCLMPRELWGALPGGMPYYVITN